MSSDRVLDDVPLFFNRAIVPLGWTGGQYSLYRAALAIWLGLVTWYVQPGADWWAHEEFLGWQGPLAFSPWHCGILSGLAVLIAIGWCDRLAAGAAVIVALSAATGFEWRVIQVLLAAHALSRGAPFGSLAAVGRVDPGGGWRRSTWNAAFACLPALQVVALLPAIFVWSMIFRFGSESLHDGPTRGFMLVLVVVSVFLVARSASLHRMLWLAWLLYCAYVLYLAAFVGEALDWEDAIMSLIAFAAFDPAMIRGRRGTEPEVVYYDGDCGLCHRTVRFLLAEDLHGDAFRYAALQSEHFAQHVSDSEREELGDSVIVRTSHGRLLQRSSAIVHLLLALGGLWRIIGSLIWCIPRPLRDLGYDAIAKVRKRVFPAPQGLCPLISPELGGRFLG